MDILKKRIDEWITNYHSHKNSIGILMDTILSEGISLVNSLVNELLEANKKIAELEKKLKEKHK